MMTHTALNEENVKKCLLQGEYYLFSDLPKLFNEISSEEISKLEDEIMQAFLDRKLLKGLYTLCLNHSFPDLQPSYFLINANYYKFYRIVDYFFDGFFGKDELKNWAYLKTLPPEKTQIKALLSNAAIHILGLSKILCKHKNTALLKKLYKRHKNCPFRKMFG